MADNRIKTRVSSVSEIITDEHGFEYINLILEDGVKGFYPGKPDLLSGFKPGLEVSYSGTKKFNGMNKIIGLIAESPVVPSNPGIGRIVGITSVFTLKGWYTRTVRLDNDITANVVAKQLNVLSQYKVGSLVSYNSVKETEGLGAFFDGLKKEFEYTAEDRRQLSIMRQSCLKVATELYLAANSKNVSKSDWDSVINEVTSIANKLVDYVNVD